MITAIALLIVSLPMIARPTEAQSPGVTRADHIFCVSLENYHRQSEILASGDREAWGRFIENPRNQCAVLKAGIRVYVSGVGGLRNIGIVRMRPEGETVDFYTATEAVRRTGG